MILLTPAIRSRKNLPANPSRQARKYQHGDIPEPALEQHPGQPRHPATHVDHAGVHPDPAASSIRRDMPGCC
jgi:hypothetical protein